MSQRRFLFVWLFLPFKLPYFLTISDIYPCLLDISAQHFLIFHKVCDTFTESSVYTTRVTDCLCLNLSICIDINMRYPNKPSETHKMLHLLTVNISEKLFFFLTGTRIGQASECFVYWKDPMTNDTWGLNFTSPIDAKQFRECCVSNVYFGYNCIKISQ